MVPRPGIEPDSETYHVPVLPINYRGFLSTILHKTQFDKLLP
tara:strand:- start:555 stop:680 length:126 start_codon:yes stop_codon:yes gene_type:complete